MIEKICVQCNTPFSVPAAWVRKGNRRFCSQMCYTLYQREHPHTTRGKIAHPHIELICEHCGKAFRVQIARREQNFCSKSCRAAHVRITKTCVVCGKDFTVLQVHADRYTCCSIECKHANTIHIPCARCGKIFRKAPNYNYRYCSEECRRPPVFLTCLNCDKQFRVVPSEISKKRFCSTRCYRRFIGETNPERNARLCLETLDIEYRQEHSLPGWRSPVDFFLPTLNTCLEIDGNYWHTKTGVAERDARKTLYLQSQGYQVIRLPDTVFHGSPTEPMIAYLKSALFQCG